MAYVKINPVKSAEHLTNAIDYISKEYKTNNQILVDSFHCSLLIAERDFAAIRNRAMKKGNNIAWHLKQSFAPEDNVTPEQALELGKELMKRMYPNHQYIIATYIDRGHIHNHILINSVNFEDYHKLHSNKNTLNELRSIGDDICRENGLVVIEKDSLNHKQRLKENIDKAIEKATDFDDFIALMQESGYNVKLDGKHLAFKDEKMQRFMRSSSISIDYKPSIIKHRISTEKENITGSRTIYDDKLSYRSARKKMKAEIDSSIKKCNSYEEFIADMERKGYTTKEGKHLAFLGVGQERFIRCDSIDKEHSYRYSRDGIRYQIEHRELFEKINNSKLKKVLDKSKLKSGLYNWASGENANAKIATDNFIRDIVIEQNGAERGSSYNNYQYFMKNIYRAMQDKISAQEEQIKALEQRAKELSQGVKSLQNYAEFKPKVMRYHRKGVKNLEGEEKADYKSCYGKYKYAEECIAKYGFEHSTMQDLKNELAEVQEQLQKINEQIIVDRLHFENYEIARFNCESKDGWVYSVDDTHTVPDETEQERKTQEQEQQEDGTKRRLRDFFR